MYVTFLRQYVLTIVFICKWSPSNKERLSSRVQAEKCIIEITTIMQLIKESFIELIFKVIVLTKCLVEVVSSRWLHSILKNFLYQRHFLLFF